MEDNNVQSNIINVKSHSDEKIHEIMEFAGIGRNETIKVLDFMCDEKNEIFKARLTLSAKSRNELLMRHSKRSSQ